MSRILCCAICGLSPPARLTPNEPSARMCRLQWTGPYNFGGLLSVCVSSPRPPCPTIFVHVEDALTQWSSTAERCRTAMLLLPPTLSLLLLLPSVHTQSELCQYLYESKGQSEEGTFSTPQYPKTYPANTRCTFHFRAAEDQVVWIDWRQFHLEQARSDVKQCLNDYVEVVIIDFQNRQHVKGRYCGDEPPPNFHTMQKSIDIIFRSSFTHHYKGFEGVYKFIAEKDIQPPVSSQTLSNNRRVAYSCGGFASGKHGGVIQNPGYPDLFPAGLDCNWIIRVEPTKRIVIKLLELELTDSMAECGNARLEVYDGYAHSLLSIYNSDDLATVPKLDADQQVRFCGDEKYYGEEGQKSYMSVRNRVLIRFVTTKGPSDKILAKRKQYGSPVGFKLVWTEVEAENHLTGVCDEFFCKGGEVCIEAVCTDRWRYCIDKSLVCDGVPHCAEFDQSDEENCYSTEIIGAGVSIFVFLVFVIVSVVCCQRMHNRKHLKRHKNDFRDESVLEGRSMNNAPVHNVTVDQPIDHVELSALPANYHGYSNGKRSTSNMEMQLTSEMSTSSPCQPPPYDVCQARCRRAMADSLPPVVVRVPNVNVVDSEEDIWEPRPCEGMPLMRRIPPAVATKPVPPAVPLKPILKPTPPPMVPSNVRSHQHVGFTSNSKLLESQFEDDNDNTRSASPWHHQVTPTEV